MLLKEQENIKRVYANLVDPKLEEMRQQRIKENDAIFDRVLHDTRWDVIVDALADIGFPNSRDALKKFIKNETMGYGVPRATSRGPIHAALEVAGWNPKELDREFAYNRPTFLELMSALIISKKKWAAIQPLVVGWAAEIGMAKSVEDIDAATHKFCEELGK